MLCVASDIHMVCIVHLPAAKLTKGRKWVGEWKRERGSGSASDNIWSSNGLQWISTPDGLSSVCRGGNHLLRLTRVKRVGVKEKAGEGERRRRWFLERGDGVRLCDCVSQECVFLCHLALMWASAYNTTYFLQFSIPKTVAWYLINSHIWLWCMNCSYFPFSLLWAQTHLVMILNGRTSLSSYKMYYNRVWS